MRGGPGLLQKFSRSISLDFSSQIRTGNYFRKLVNSNLRFLEISARPGLRGPRLWGVLPGLNFPCVKQNWARRVMSVGLGLGSGGRGSYFSGASFCL